MLKVFVQHSTQVGFTVIVALKWLCLTTQRMLMDQLLPRYGKRCVEKRRSSPYHPDGNGFSRKNQKESEGIGSMCERGTEKYDGKEEREI